MPPPDASPRQQQMRASMLAVAQWMLVYLPDAAPQKPMVIDHLAVAAGLADEALTSG